MRALLSADHVGRAKCGHEFHEDCIDNLIKTKGSCPGCKLKGECVNSKAKVSTNLAAQIQEQLRPARFIQNFRALSEIGDM